MSIDSAYDRKTLADDLFTHAISYFNRGQWYAAHDLFEELWHEAMGDLRELLQGIIQISVAEYHLENGNSRGSLLLMAEGLNHLEASHSLDIGYDLASLKDIVSRRLVALQEQLDPADIPAPSLKPVTEATPVTAKHAHSSQSEG